MTRDRLKLALRNLAPEEWRRFEEFASQFLTSEFPNLRTTAGTGDRGRDAELYQPDGANHILLQYSVAENWKAKIFKTVKRIQENFDDCRILIYATNQTIGPRGDDLKTQLITEFGLVLDIRDSAYFLDRHRRDANTEAASEELARAIVDPLLQKAGVETEPTGLALSDEETKAALTFLGLQRADDNRGKGLTRTAYEAIVVSVLRHTNSESRLSREEVHRKIQGVLPHHPAERLRELTERALKRLTKKRIRHWTKEDEFCLTHKESERITKLIESEAASSSDVDQCIQDTAKAHFPENFSHEELKVVGKTMRKIVEVYLWDRGESFAAAVSEQESITLSSADLENIVNRVVASEHTDHLKYSAEGGSYFLSSVVDLLRNPHLVVQEYFRKLADSYTLLAFLKETPDVQQALRKTFHSATIWLDTSFLLPLIAEELLDAERRRFNITLKAAREAGLKFRVTDGVLEELASHIKLCVTYCRPSAKEWIGRIPFLARVYLTTGRSSESFASWVERFRGYEQPTEDLADYLLDFYEIKRQNLMRAANQAPDDLRFAVQEIWHEAHLTRRTSSNRTINESLLDRLVRHDVENYVGVIQKRKRQTKSPLGYTVWWLTLDKTAYRVRKKLEESLETGTPPPSPVMSADFLLDYLALGPPRAKVSETTELSLPLFIESGPIFDLTDSILDEAQKVRDRYKDQPEHVIRRQVRDYISRAQKQIGPLTHDAFERIFDDIEDESLVGESKTS